MKWIEILRTGSFRDKHGTDFAPTPETLRTIAERYDPAYLEAPVVVGHPKDNAPAYGWVKELKVSGDRLLARLDQLDPAFVEMVKAGRFKTRSSSVLLDFEGKGPYLQHVGFLGAKAPAVKGLKEVQFQGGDAAVIELEEEDKGMELSEFFKGLREFRGFFGKGEPDDGGKSAVGLSDDDKKKLREELKAELAAEEGELKTKVADLEAKLEKASASAAAGEASLQRRAAAEFVERLQTEGRVTPAMQPDTLVELLTAVEGVEAEVSLSEGEGDDAKTVKASPRQALERLLEGLPKQVDFSERTAGDGGRPSKVIPYTPDARREAVGVELAERAEKIAQEKDIPYGEALRMARKQQSA